jgi:hypothetical protein
MRKLVCTDRTDIWMQGHRKGETRRQRPPPQTKRARLSATSPSQGAAIPLGDHHGWGPRREQHVLPCYGVRLSREIARRLVRCYELGQASVLVFQIFMGATPYKRVENPSCAAWSCRHRSYTYTNRTQAQHLTLSDLQTFGLRDQPQLPRLHIQKLFWGAV